MRVLVTGSDGFIGRNLRESLTRTEGVAIDTFDREDSGEKLREAVERADFIYHLAGVNRPENPEEFYRSNRDLTRSIAELAEETGRAIPILMSSSIQAERTNDYGRSKREAEEILEHYAKRTGAAVYLYRLPNVFGKWSRPEYNSVVATWCHHIARGLPIRVDDERTELDLVYIDDVVEHFIRHLEEDLRGVTRPRVHPVYRRSLGEIRALLEAFRASRETLEIPPVGRGFERALYATYLSFLPPEDFAYPLRGFRDKRGTFYEVIKTRDSGQISVSTTVPGITRGEHYHHTKNEKFLVLRGEALIRLRRIDSDEVIEYRVDGKRMEIVEMIPGYTHNITNVGEEELILLIWANETFDRNRPDTYFLKVEKSAASSEAANR